VGGSGPHLGLVRRLEAGVLPGQRGSEDVGGVLPVPRWSRESAFLEQACRRLAHQGLVWRTPQRVGLADRNPVPRRRRPLCWAKGGWCFAFSAVPLRVAFVDAVCTMCVRGGAVVARVYVTRPIAEEAPAAARAAVEAAVWPDSDTPPGRNVVVPYGRQPAARQERTISTAEPEVSEAEMAHVVAGLKGDRPPHTVNPEVPRL
jgi:hypothetical protein